MKKERIIEEEGDGPTRTFFALLPLRHFCLKVDGDDDDTTRQLRQAACFPAFSFLHVATMTVFTHPLIYIYL